MSIYTFHRYPTCLIQSPNFDFIGVDKHWCYAMQLLAAGEKTCFYGVFQLVMGHPQKWFLLDNPTQISWKINL